MAAKDDDNASDEIIGTKCCVCIGKNISRSAEKYCMDCQDYYCIPCTDTHKTFPLMRGHKLLDKADFSTHGFQSTLPCFPTQRCQIHKGKLLDMFCKNHDEVVCATCVAINHRTCQSIHSIPDEVDNLYPQSALDQTKKQLLAAKMIVESSKKEKQQLLRELKEQKQRATDSIINYRKELEVQLKRLENESLRVVDAQYNSMEKILQSGINEAEKYIGDLEESTARLQESNRNKAQEFVCVKNAQKNITKARSSQQTLQKQREVKISFFADMKIKNNLKQLKALGQLSTAEATYNPRTTAYKVKQQRSVDIKLKEDKETCAIFGSCFTEDGSLLLADFNNSKLKRLDVFIDTITDKLDLWTGPFCVCLTSKEEAAVSLCYRSIQIVSLGDKMTTTRTLWMDHGCFGLAFNDGKFFITDQCITVYIHDTNGTILRKITNDKTGRSIFSHNQHVSVSSNRKCLYVTDIGKGLITLDMEGNDPSKFSKFNLVNARALCTDGRGSILVCGNESPNIVQIREGSKIKLGVINTDTCPLSFCFGQNKLAVVNGNRNTLNIYELE